jgi:hypothetical protein
MRAPSNAPAVRYPYGRSRALGWVLSAVSVCGLASTLAWLSFGTTDTDRAIKAAAGLGLWLCCSIASRHWWRSMPVGHLAWDGSQWLLERPVPGHDQTVQGRPQVHLDLQAGMLLSMQPVQGRTAWLWLERQIDPLQWLALRRAVYSPARVQAPDSQAPASMEAMSATRSRREDGSPTKT